MAQTMIELVCPICESTYQRVRSEVLRSNRLGRPIYCSRSCAGKANLKNIPEDTKIWEHLRGYSRKDGYSSFKVFLRTARRRSVEFGLEFSLNLELLKELWGRQQGICPYTGWKMLIPESSGEYIGGRWKLRPQCASLDRIDPKKGYVSGNVQFVCYMANCAKNRFSHDEMIVFCKAIATHWSE